MGNYRFRFSDMIPNAWFYKLKDMSKTRKKQNKTTKKLLQNNPSSVTTSPSSSSLSLSLSSTAAAAPKPHLSDQRKSYYFSRDLNLNSDSLPKTKITDQHLTVEPPRKSSRRRRSTKRHRPQQRLVSSSVSAVCSCRATIESWTKSPEDYTNSPINETSSSDNDSIVPGYGSDRGLTPDTFDGMLSWSTSCKCSIDNDGVIDMNNNNNNRFEQGFDSEQDHLPPIITRKQEPTNIQRTPAEFLEKNAYGSLSVKVVKEDFLSTTTTMSNSSKNHPHKTTTSPVRRYSPHSSSPGVKLRTNSPRLANRRIQGRKSVSSNSSLGSRRSISESFAVVKSSKDPRRDFRESMVEMIVENNIIGSKDLEELLACYLSLNSDEYHDIIINVFKQIWCDFLK